MDHIAIMQKTWGLTEKIVTGQKTIESRWYNVKYAPWGRISPGDSIFFKNSSEPVTIQAEVEKVLYFILIYLKHAQPIPPFEINKQGFGAMSSWICVEHISKIKAYL
jgi:ASC-1-like (ASCH) protein